MEGYEVAMGIVEYYKNKACELVEGNCDKCEAMHEHSDEKWCCCFDTVMRFIKWNNQYNI